MVHGVHAGHNRGQHLRGADIARRPLPADVLFARLQRHAQSSGSKNVLGNADDASWHMALEARPSREVSGVGAPVSHRHSQALGASHDHVRSQLAGRFQDRQGEDVRCDRNQSSRLMRAPAEVIAVTPHSSIRGGKLEQSAETGLSVEVEIPVIPHDYLPAL